MKEGLRLALRQSFGCAVNSEGLEAGADNLLSFFTLLIEADRQAGYPVLNDTIYGRMSEEEVEYMFT